jgi:hypothetical protein
MNIYKVSILLALTHSLFCQNDLNLTKGNTSISYDLNLSNRVEYCNSLNESINPTEIDCTYIDVNCCYAYYTIRTYQFKLCFYNAYMDNTKAKSFFEYKIGSIAQSPFINLKVSCISYFMSSLWIGILFILFLL